MNEDHDEFITEQEFEEFNDDNNEFEENFQLNNDDNIVQLQNSTVEKNSQMDQHYSSVDDNQQVKLDPKDKVENTNEGINEQSKNEQMMETNSSNKIYEEEIKENKMNSTVNSQTKESQLEMEQFAEEKKNDIMKDESIKKDNNEISENLLNEYKEAFALFDKNGDGTIPANELGILLRGLGKNPTQDEVDDLIYEFNEKHEGYLDFPQFLKVLQREFRPPDSEEDVIRAFEVFDTNGNGLIAAEELKNILSTLGEPLNEEELSALLKDAEVDSNGMISYREFINKAFGHL